MGSQSEWATETEWGANLVLAALLALTRRIDHKHNERAPGCHLRRRPIGSSKFPASLTRVWELRGTGMPVSRSNLKHSRVVRSPAEMM